MEGEYDTDDETLQLKMVRQEYNLIVEDEYNNESDKEDLEFGDNVSNDDDTYMSVLAWGHDLDKDSNDTDKNVLDYAYLLHKISKNSSQ